MSMPLVSVMMPCFNSTPTLPWALSSLIAQTYPNWECILVDDGSSDNPEAMVLAADDQRIKYVRFSENRGRAVARQAALDHSNGAFLTMLDADDWLYPNKFERQVQAMIEHPEVALVSTGMAIVDTDNHLVGIRAQGKSSGKPLVEGPFVKLAAPPVAHAPSMIRMDIARSVKYDPAFPLAQDVDYLLRLLLDRQYCILSDSSYVYTEHATSSLNKIVTALRLTRTMYMKHQERFPLQSRTNAGKTFLKEWTYRAAFTLGRGEQMIARRSIRPNETYFQAFSDAKASVGAIAQERFSGDPKLQTAVSLAS